MSKVYILKFNKNHFEDGDLILPDCLEGNRKDIPLIEYEYTNYERTIGYCDVNQDEEGVYIENCTIGLDKIINNIGFAAKVRNKDGSALKPKLDFSERKIEVIEIVKIIPLVGVTFCLENDKS